MIQILKIQKKKKALRMPSKSKVALLDLPLRTLLEYQKVYYSQTDGCEYA